MSSEPFDEDVSPTIAGGRASSEWREIEVPAQIGRYRVIGSIGSGGMGRVLSAYHPDLDRRVAIKVLRDSTSSGEDAELLLREAQAMARLSHPNVLPVHDVGRDGERVYIVMELVEGETLAERLKRGPMAVAEAIDILRQVARGLAAAHRAGLIHRDLKPANILLGNDGRARLADFGIARSSNAAVAASATVATGGSLLDTSTTRAGVTPGTLLYMAPEQLRGEPASERSDQYGLCVTAFETLYGRTPTNAADSLAQRHAVPSEVPGRGEPAFFRAAILKGLSIEPASRFASVAELLAVFEREPFTLTRLVPWVAMLVIIAAAVGAVWHFTRPQAIAGCGDGERNLAAIWSAERQQRLAQVFVAAAGESGAREAKLAAGALDAFAANWATSAEAECRSALERRDANPPSVTCLEQERMQLAALLEVFATADKNLVSGAVKAATSLTPPERCLEPNILATLPRVPANPELRVRVQEVRLRLATSNARNLIGQHRRAEQDMSRLAALADEIGYGPLRAEVGMALTQAHSALGEDVETLGIGRRTILIALEHGMPLVAAEALALTGNVGNYSGRVEQAGEWLENAEALLKAAGGDALVGAGLENAMATHAAIIGNLPVALSHAERAYQLRARVLGSNHPRTVVFLNNLGTAYQDQCRDAEAVKLLGSSLNDRLLAQSPAIYLEGAVRAAEAALLLGDLAEAGRLLAMAGNVAATTELELNNRIMLLVIQARFFSDLKRGDEAVAAGTEAARLAVIKGENSAYYPYALGSLAKAQLTAGQTRLASETIQKGIAKSRDLALPVQGFDFIVLAQASLANGQRKQALQALDDARKALAATCTRPAEQAATTALAAALAPAGLRAPSSSP